MATGDRAILLPYHSLVTVTSLEATPAAFGAEIATQELRCAFDGDPKNFTKIWSASDQPIDFQYASLTLPFTATGGLSAWWVEIENGAFEDLGGATYNGYQFLSSSDGISYSGLTCVHYGDGTASGGGAVLLSTPAPTNGVGASCNGQTVIYYDQLTTGRYQRLLVTSQSGSGENYKVYELMNGILFVLPASHVSEGYDSTRNYFGGSVEYNDFNRVLYSGRRSEKPRKTRTVTMEALTLAQRDLYINIFKYGRGTYPVLWIEDTAHRDSWFKAYMQTLAWFEPNAGQYRVELTFEEC